jgi:hypothetical protein
MGDIVSFECGRVTTVREAEAVYTKRLAEKDTEIARLREQLNAK